VFADCNLSAANTQDANSALSQVIRVRGFLETIRSQFDFLRSSHSPKVMIADVFFQTLAQSNLQLDNAELRSCIERFAAFVFDQFRSEWSWCGMEFYQGFFQQKIPVAFDATSGRVISHSTWGTLLLSRLTRSTSIDSGLLSSIQQMIATMHPVTWAWLSRFSGRAELFPSYVSLGIAKPAGDRCFLITDSTDSTKGSFISVPHGILVLLQQMLLLFGVFERQATQASRTGASFTMPAVDLLSHPRLELSQRLSVDFQCSVPATCVPSGYHSATARRRVIETMRDSFVADLHFPTSFSVTRSFTDFMV